MPNALQGQVVITIVYSLFLIVQSQRWYRDTVSSNFSWNFAKTSCFSFSGLNLSLSLSLSFSFFLSLLHLKCSRSTWESTPGCENGLLPGAGECSFSHVGQTCVGLFQWCEPGMNLIPPLPQSRNPLETSEGIFDCYSLRGATSSG